MTRASAATADICLQRPVGPRRQGASAPAANSSLFKAFRGKRALVWAAGLAAILAIAMAIAAALHHVRGEQDLALNAAAREVEVRAALLAATLDAALDVCSVP